MIIRIAFLLLLSSSYVVGDEPVFSPLFNGEDLTGWVNCNVADNTFVATDGILATTGKPTGLLRTEKMYENFIVEFDWRHLQPGGNSGLFIWADGLPAVGSAFPRGIEVQILDPGFDVPGKNQWYSTHGDIFAVNGSDLHVAGKISPNGQRSFPAEERTLPSPQWNHYRVEAVDGDIRLSVNGKEVTIAENANPRKGYLMLESEGARCEFRNVMIAELPSTGAVPSQTANRFDGFRSIFNGIDFAGWKVPQDDNGHWKIKDEVIDYDAKSESSSDKNLWSQQTYKNYELVVDWRIKAAPYINPNVYEILADGTEALDDDGKPKPIPQHDADSGIYLRGNDKYQINIWCWPVGSGDIYGVRRDPMMPASTRAGVTPKVKADNPVGQWNRFEITVMDETVNVVLNGQVVIDNVTIPGFPSEGPIALQHHGSQNNEQWTSSPALVQFRNLFIRNLP